MALKARVQRQKYAAHVLDYRNTVTRALEDAHEWVAIFEDDIVLTTPPSVASARIRQAMAQVPPDTDRYRFLDYIACCDLFAKAWASLKVVRILSLYKCAAGNFTNHLTQVGKRHRPHDDIFHLTK